MVLFERRYLGQELYTDERIGFMHSRLLVCIF